MEIHTCGQKGITHVAFLDPMKINQMMIATDPQPTEDYALEAIQMHQLKRYILLPYNFGYVFSSMFVLLFLSITTLGLRTNYLL
jgi:hypothetical protein